MNEPLGLLNGQRVPASQVMLSACDAGFVLGATAAEQLRTFGGQLFDVEAHLARLTGSLATLEVALPMAREALAAAAHELAAHNHALLAEGDDLGLCIFVTPGLYPSFGMGQGGPTLGVHTYPLPFANWAAAYDEGVALECVEVEQPSPRSWPAALKCRSRVHYYLADLEARRRRPGARALLHDAAGYVTETATANLLAVIGGRLVSPRREKILPGVTLSHTLRLAGELGIACVDYDLTPSDLAAADELLLTSTPSGILPVSLLDGQPVGKQTPADEQSSVAGKQPAPAERGIPGPVYQALLTAWQQQTGISLADQARAFAQRG